MKKILLLTILFVVTMSLTACSGELKYTFEELVVDVEPETLDAKEGLTFDEIMENGYFLMYYQSDRITNDDDTESIYTRLFYVDEYTNYRIQLLTRIISLNLDEIKEVFPNPEDIEYIVVSSEENLLSFLPSNDVAYTKDNTVLIDIGKSMNESNNQEDTKHDDSYIDLLEGYNFRDIFVALFNISYEEEKLDAFDTLLNGTHFAVNDINYIDTVVTYEDGLKTTDFVATTATELPVLCSSLIQNVIPQVPVNYELVGLQAGYHIISDDSEDLVVFD